MHSKKVETKLNIIYIKSVRKRIRGIYVVIY